MKENELLMNKEEYFKLKSLYKKAIENNELLIEFQGNKLLVSYTKYLLEHLKNKYE